MTPSPRWPFLLALTLGLSPSLAAAPAEADAAAGIEGAMQEYVRLVKTTDGAKISACYAAEGELLEPGMEALKGREAIRKFLDSFAGVRIESASMTTETIQVFGTDAIQWGRYAQRAVVKDQAPMDLRGRFVAQWTRDGAGRWLIRRLLMQPFPS